jgi:hypothetical protein
VGGTPVMRIALALEQPTVVEIGLDTEMSIFNRR